MKKRIFIDMDGVLADFGDIFHKKIVFTHRKDLLLGDYLIDDRLANGVENFTGALLRFGWD